LSISSLFELPELFLPGKEPDDLTIVVDGEELVLESARVIRSIDTGADAFSASLPFDPSDEKLAELLKPYGYQSTAVYLGEDIVINGFLFIMENEFTTGGIRKIIEGATITANIVDSNLLPPYQYNKIKFEDIASTILEPFGIGIRIDSSAIQNLFEPFDRVVVEPTDKAFDFLAGLARQRGVLLTCNPEGELVATKAASGRPVASIKEEAPPQQEYRIRFDGRKRFAKYLVLGQTPKKVSISASALDAVPPEGRINIIKAGNESTQGNIQDAADWARSKAVADTMTFPVPVYSWYTKPDGDLWEPNTLVTIESAAMNIPDGFDFLIRSVEYEWSSGGTPAVLNVVPPNVFTGEEIIDPWS
jgi:prophage tail gpP-like protein